MLHRQEVLVERALARKSRKEVRGGQARQTLQGLAVKESREGSESQGDVESRGERREQQR